MCGRFALHIDANRLESLLGATVPASYRPRYNIAPTQPILTLHRVDEEARLIPLH